MLLVRTALLAALLLDAPGCGTATGYAEGDLRGWFWVDVPPAR